MGREVDEWMTIPIRKDLHRAMKQKALDEGKKLIHLMDEVLVDALNFKEVRSGKNQDN
jgi:hypothetical protein